jgi:hypothetical protein
VDSSNKFILVSGGVITKVPTFCSVYFLHGAKQYGAGNIAPQFPIANPSMTYAYCLSYPQTLQPFGLAYYGTAPDNSLFVGPLTSSAFYVSSADVAYAIAHSMSSGYVDLYYF